MNGHWGSETGGSWTAISKAPYLKALTLYGKGDCWNGGGLFADAGSFVIYAVAVLILLVRPAGLYGRE